MKIDLENAVWYYMIGSAIGWIAGIIYMISIGRL
jgi:hypothetical protein